jgi:hypothetical protein
VQGSSNKPLEAAKPQLATTEPARQTASQDRYSALKELDELFKSTTLNSKPVNQ